MPPSPSLRDSFRGDPRGDSHKRGRSLESGLSFREKDDDLALFNELQNRDKDNFLLESTDDFDDLLSSKIKPFPDLKLGISIAARGESSDLLNVDSDKNDYEWLMTPPETPLFPSLDDEPAPFNVVHNGRARTRPISISRSSTMEKSRRSSRGSPSPQRSSPSPKSTSSSFLGRPSPAPSYSVSPSRRQSPPPVKSSTSPSRSLTPTSQRASAGSPVRSNRGNSASPKVRAWQSNVPGFSLEAPPNLRTSVADRPASYIRGSSPASRASKDSSAKHGRQSMSPIPSRSIGSSGDYDIESLHSGPASVSERTMSRKGVSGSPSGRPLSFSKKPTKTFSPSSAPKRSFDSTPRPDRTPPQNMFRPLLSSVPSSTFYSGKPNSAQSTLISRNSSDTTSNNTSCDQPTNAAHIAEESVLNRDGMASDCARETSSDIHDDTRPEIGGKDYAFASNPGDSEESGYREQLIVAGQLDVQCGVRNTLICSICGSHYRPDELAENPDCIICFECKGKELLSSVPLMDNSNVSRDISEISQKFLENSLPVSMEEETMDSISKHQVTTESGTLDDPSHTSSCNSGMKSKVSEGAGISVLLNSSRSFKGPIAHGRTINSSAISFEDLSYSRDWTSSMRSSTGRGSFSASSSTDMTSTRHGEMFLRRQLSGKLSDPGSKPQSTVSSFSATSMPVYRAFGGHSTSSHDGSFEGSVSNVRFIGPDHILPSENSGPSAVGIGESHIQEIVEDQHNRICTEEVTSSDYRIRQVDVTEDVPGQYSSSTMSVIEINDSHPSSPRSQIDVVFREDLEDSAASTHCDIDTHGASLESAQSDHADKIVEESTVTTENRGKRTRSLTLEEATDTILFCNSVIHDLAYKAANIAIEKEKENLEPLEGSRPTVTIPDKSTSDRKDSHGVATGRTPKTQKARKRRTSEIEAKPPLSQNDDVSNEPVVRNVGLRNNSDNMKPHPKLESKCNCTIM